MIEYESSEKIQAWLAQASQRVSFCLPDERGSITEEGNIISLTSLREKPTAVPGEKEGKKPVVPKLNLLTELPEALQDKLAALNLDLGEMQPKKSITDTRVKGEKSSTKTPRLNDDEEVKDDETAVLSPSDRTEGAISNTILAKPNENTQKKERHLRHRASVTMSTHEGIQKLLAHDLDKAIDAKIVVLQSHSMNAGDFTPRLIAQRLKIGASNKSNTKVAAMPEKKGKVIHHQNSTGNGHQQNDSSNTSRHNTSNTHHDSHHQKKDHHKHAGKNLTVKTSATKKLDDHHKEASPKEPSVDENRINKTNTKKSDTESILTSKIEDEEINRDKQKSPRVWDAEYKSPQDMYKALFGVSEHSQKKFERDKKRHFKNLNLETNLNQKPIGHDEANASDGYCSDDLDDLKMWRHKMEVSHANKAKNVHIFGYSYTSTDVRGKGFALKGLAESEERHKHAKAHQHVLKQAEKKRQKTILNDAKAKLELAKEKRKSQARFMRKSNGSTSNTVSEDNRNSIRYGTMGTVSFDANGYALQATASAPATPRGEHEPEYRSSFRHHGRRTTVKKKFIPNGTMEGRFCGDLLIKRKIGGRDFDDVHYQHHHKTHYTDVRIGHRISINNMLQDPEYLAALEEEKMRPIENGDRVKDLRKAARKWWNEYPDEYRWGTVVRVLGSEQRASRLGVKGGLRRWGGKSIAEVEIVEKKVVTTENMPDDTGSSEEEYNRKKEQEEQEQRRAVAIAKGGKAAAKSNVGKDSYNTQSTQKAAVAFSQTSKPSSRPGSSEGRNRDEKNVRISRKRQSEADAHLYTGKNGLVVRWDSVMPTEREIKYRERTGKRMRLEQVKKPEIGVKVTDVQREIRAISDFEWFPDVLPLGFKVGLDGHQESSKKPALPFQAAFRNSFSQHGFTIQGEFGNREVVKNKDSTGQFAENMLQDSVDPTRQLISDSGAFGTDNRNARITENDPLLGIFDDTEYVHIQKPAGRLSHWTHMVQDIVNETDDKFNHSDVKKSSDTQLDINKLLRGPENQSVYDPAVDYTKFLRSEYNEDDQNQNTKKSKDKEEKNIPLQEKRSIKVGGRDFSAFFDESQPHERAKGLMSGSLGRGNSDDEDEVKKSSGTVSTHDKNKKYAAAVLLPDQRLSENVRIVGDDVTVMKVGNPGTDRARDSYQDGREMVVLDDEGNVRANKFDETENFVLFDGGDMYFRRSQELVNIQDELAAEGDSYTSEEYDSAAKSNGNTGVHPGTKNVASGRNNSKNTGRKTSKANHTAKDRKTSKERNIQNKNSTNTGRKTSKENSSGGSKKTPGQLVSTTMKAVNKFTRLLGKKKKLRINVPDFPDEEPEKKIDIYRDEVHGSHRAGENSIYTGQTRESFLNTHIPQVNVINNKDEGQNSSSVACGLNVEKFGGKMQNMSEMMKNNILKSPRKRGVSKEKMNTQYLPTDTSTEENSSSPKIVEQKSALWGASTGMIPVVKKKFGLDRGPRASAKAHAAKNAALAAFTGISRTPKNYGAEETSGLTALGVLKFKHKLHKKVENTAETNRYINKIAKEIIAEQRAHEEGYNLNFKTKYAKNRLSEADILKNNDHDMLAIPTKGIRAVDSADDLTLDIPIANLLRPSPDSDSKSTTSPTNKLHDLLHGVESPKNDDVDLSTFLSRKMMREEADGDSHVVQSPKNKNPKNLKISTANCDSTLYDPLALTPREFAEKTLTPGGGRKWAALKDRIVTSTPRGMTLEKDGDLNSMRGSILVENLTSSLMEEVFNENDESMQRQSPKYSNNNNNNPEALIVKEKISYDTYKQRMHYGVDLDFGTLNSPTLKQRGFLNDIEHQESLVTKHRRSLLALYADRTSTTSVDPLELTPRGEKPANLIDQMPTLTPRDTVSHMKSAEHRSSLLFDGNMSFRSKRDSTGKNESTNTKNNLVVETVSSGFLTSTGASNEKRQSADSADSTTVNAAAVTTGKTTVSFNRLNPSKSPYVNNLNQSNYDRHDPYKERQEILSKLSSEERQEFLSGLRTSHNEFITNLNERSIRKISLSSEKLHTLQVTTPRASKKEKTKRLSEKEETVLKDKKSSAGPSTSTKKDDCTEEERLTANGTGKVPQTLKRQETTTVEDEKKVEVIGDEWDGDVDGIYCDWGSDDVSDGEVSPTCTKPTSAIGTSTSTQPQQAVRFNTSTSTQVVSLPPIEQSKKEAKIESKLAKKTNFMDWEYGLGINAMIAQEDPVKKFEKIRHQPGRNEFIDYDKKTRVKIDPITREEIVTVEMYTKYETTLRELKRAGILLNKEEVDATLAQYGGDYGDYPPYSQLNDLTYMSEINFECVLVIRKKEFVRDVKLFYGSGPDVEDMRLADEECRLAAIEKRERELLNTMKGVSKRTRC